MYYNPRMGLHNKTQIPTLTNSDLPPRVAKVLRHLLDLTHAEFFPRIDPMLDQLDSMLYRDTEKSRNPSEQLDLLKASQVLRERRSAFAAALFRQLEAQLASIRSNTDTAPQTATSVLPSTQNLTLADEPEVDIRLQLRELATPLEGASSLPLYLMGQRFGVLAAKPAFTSAQLPLGPQGLLQAAAAASQSVFGEFIQQRLLGLFCSHVLADCARYLEKINAALEDDGILPGLAFVPARPVRASRSVNPSPDTAATRPPVPDAPPAPTTVPLPSSFPPAGLAPAGLAPSHAQATGQPPLAWLDQVATEGFTGQEKQTRPANFRQLQQLLAASRFASHPTHTPSTPAPAPSLSHAQVEDLLNQLAGQPLHSISDWQEALKKQVQTHYGEAAGLSRENTDTMDLLALLIEQISREAHGDSLVHELLQQLQRPLLHSVIAGHDFFENPEHPARQLINTIAEYDNEARLEHGADPAFEALIRQLVAQLAHSQRPDKEAFAEANQQLLAQLQQQIKRAQANEKRSVEAMQGRERMTVAKNIASDALETLLKKQPVSEALQTLLRHAWLDAMILALLRYGHPSQGWNAQLSRTEQILAILRAQAQASQELADEVESAMRRVGYHDEDASAIAKQLSQSPATAAQSGEAPAEALAQRIQSHPRFGMDDASEPTATPDIHIARDALEDAYYQQLSTLPFGTWFDFIGENGHEVSRRRLSWYSPVTEHALFVNRRGQKTDIIHLDTLAKRMAKGKVRLTERSQLRLVDRALAAVVSSLQRLLRSHDATRTTLQA
ncbi:hypothetical protein CO613_10765 [Lysobacteraceae bacterium NML07-0707]|nr:hypothetical protein CO613_10765 [Xanthomonadaceae bacterium NML07-0707]